MGRCLVRSEPSQPVWDSSYNRFWKKLSLVTGSRIIKTCSVMANISITVVCVCVCVCIFGYNDVATSTDLKNTFEDILMIHYKTYYICYQRNKRWGWRKRKTKRKCKFDEDESPDGVIPLVEVVGKEDIGLFFFPQRPRTTPALLHQLIWCT
jgi:hypothetical protein